ncbi:AAA family ATPase, partial [Candidatus Parcubacteria bacterium]|nr:AAA family ATPase [Candidatus Parcubacteria bacterium]
MYYKRKLEDTILEYLDKREILAIVGPRQSGKTTLLGKIQADLKDSIFLNFEDKEVLELFEQDIKNFAKKYFNNYKYIFIDEFQHSKNGGKNLKYLYDSFLNNKIIISGSSAIDLTIHAIKFLVGRIFVFNLYQLDFEEFLNFKQQDLLPIYLDYK